MLLLGTSVTSAADSTWTVFDHGRHQQLAAPGSGHAGFSALEPSAVGIRFTNHLSVERSLTNHVLMNGSGVACADVNGDGWCDVYLCGLDGDNALFLNRGNWHFEDATREAGLAGAGLDATGAVFADVDGDGDSDLILGTLGQGTRLFLNDGQGRFRDATPESGFTGRFANMSLALADVDGDGDLDLYVVNYRTSTMRDNFNLRFKVGTVDGRRVITHVNGRPVTDPDLEGRFSLLEGGGFVENGEADQFYRNDGHGHFTPVPFTGGAFRDDKDQPLTSPPYDWGLSAMFRDLNGDGAPDLYVCNDLQSPDRIWINRGDGTFRALAPLGIRRTSWFSMGVDVADLDRDGHYDLVVADMLSRDHRHRQTQDNALRFSPLTFGAGDERVQVPHTTLLLGRGHEEWSEISWFAGIAATDWSWSPVLLDVDLDGYEDLLVTTGFERDVQDMDVAREIEAERRDKRLDERQGLQLRLRFPSLAQPNLAFRNRGDLTFEEVGTRWGFDLNGVSQGIALADLDNDGDLDVVINNMNAAAAILRNETPAPRVAVRLGGRRGNTAGVGAQVRLTGGPVAQQQEIVSGGRYLSGDQSLRTFAAAPVRGPLELEVTWRSGVRTRVTGVEPGRLYEIGEPAETATAPHPQAPVSRPLFTDESPRLGHRHTEAPFNDFERQPLLPRKLSQLGPAVAWFDIDGDGWEDLLVGTGRGGDLAVLRNDGKGGFVPLASGFNRAPDDVTGIVGFVGEGLARHLVVAVGNYESASTNRPSVLISKLELRDRQAATRVVQTLPALPELVGPVAAADVNLDGHLDLFLGGRVVPGRYPEAAASRLYRGTAGGWVPDETNNRALDHLGLVSGAVFTDVNGDGASDLVLACEWGTLRLFLNEAGRLRDATAEWGLDRLPGWWTGVATGDFNADGRPDLIAGNWGLNHPAARGTETVLHGDLDENSTYDVVLGYHEPGSARLLPRATFDRLGEALPFIRGRFRGFGDYAQASVEEILGAEISHASRLEASMFESSLFLNTGSGFRRHALPRQAQLSPVFGIAVADYDGDGREDVFLAQNFFEPEPHSDRLDAGLGVLLLGDGAGGLRPSPPSESGIRVHGDQRAAAAADFDRDGRMDLVVSQNAGPTRLFRNAGGRPGLRVRLRLNAPSRDAIGAMIRPVYATGVLGPAVEVQSGGGYWSQQGSAIVLGARELISSLWIRWPGGAVTTIRAPADASDLIIDDQGQVQSVPP
jgi:hypothetical protein